MTQFGLGEEFDLSIGLAPVDLSLGANTGKRVAMSGCDSITIVIVKAAGTGGQDPTFTLLQHSVSSGGSPTNLATIDKWWHKSGATLAGSETWTEVTQAAANTVVDTGLAASQQLVVINVKAIDLTPPNKYISLDIPDTGAAAQIGAVLYIMNPQNRVTKPADYLAPLR